MINTGARTAREFMAILDKAERFRKWMAHQNPEADLIREMLREKATTGWLETIPIKALRFGIFTGGGLIAELVSPGSSVLLGATDTFVIDSLAKRWRPHYFVESNLKGFLDIDRPDRA